ncbi:hypothetical protein [Natrinema halophilum]|uniref:Uncharacterized protein n=1 Tax=Natrinema halophilum TaxID=1699371 RepID=A0A7D5KSC8_9EURY|nr:hypothetical protein [Natrinema halophilum]QLG49304.1 hypothetical protein HYG82_10745 [Natrinema halophilum]
MEERVASDASEPDEKKGACVRFRCLVGITQELRSIAIAEELERAIDRKVPITVVSS